MGPIFVIPRIGYFANELTCQYFKYKLIKHIFGKQIDIKNTLALNDSYVITALEPL
jgi:hypothetical protein